VCDVLETEGKMGMKEEREVGRALHPVLYPELHLLVMVATVYRIVAASIKLQSQPGIRRNIRLGTCSRAAFVIHLSLKLEESVIVLDCRPRTPYDVPETNMMFQNPTCRS
jgi:hypothetical protein